MERIEFRNLTK